MRKKMKKRSTSSKILKIPHGDKFRKGGAPMLYAGIDAHKRTCIPPRRDHYRQSRQENKGGSSKNSKKDI